MHVPGHSPGSVAFHHPVHGVAFTGDVLMKGVIGRTGLAESSSVAMAASPQSVMTQLPYVTVLLSGHTKETTMAQEMKSNRFLRPHMLQRLAKQDL